MIRTFALAVLGALCALSARAQEHGTAQNPESVPVVTGERVESANSANGSESAPLTVEAGSGGRPNAATALAPKLGQSLPPERAGGATSSGALPEGSRVRDFLPAIRTVEEGRYRFVEIRRKLERAYGEDWLKRLNAAEDREAFVSRLGVTLSPEDLGFLSLVMTSFGEARGQVSPECRQAQRLDTMEKRAQCLDDKIARKNLLFVMRIIENRSYSDRFVDFRRRKGPPLGRLWGVVTQPLRYSSWNPKNPNLAVMMKTVSGAKAGEQAGDLRNNSGLSTEDSVALDRVLSVYKDYVSPELRFKNFERIIGSRVHRATHMLNWDEMARLSSVSWTVEGILSRRERLRRQNRLDAAAEKRTIFIGLRIKDSEILLPGEVDGPEVDRLAHVPVYIRSLRNPTLPRLRTMKKEQDL